MPEINVTMDGEAVAVNVSAPFGYRDSGAVAAALDGETVTPGQVGTASDPVDESHVQSQHSRELSVGSGSTVTATVGTSGEFEQFGVYDYASGGYSVSSTTFQNVASSVVDHRVIDKDSVTNLTNVESVHVALSARVYDQDSGADVTVRIEGRSETELTLTAPNYAKVTTPKTDTSSGIAKNPLPELKSSDGTQATIYNPSIIVYGKIA